MDSHGDAALSGVRTGGSRRADARRAAPAPNVTQAQVDLMVEPLGISAGSQSISDDFVRVFFSPDGTAASKQLLEAAWRLRMDVADAKEAAVQRFECVLAATFQDALPGGSDALGLGLPWYLGAHARLAALFGVLDASFTESMHGVRSVASASNAMAMATASAERCDKRSTADEASRRAHDYAENWSKVLSKVTLPNFDDRMLYSKCGGPEPVGTSILYEFAGKWIDDDGLDFDNPDSSINKVVEIMRHYWLLKDLTIDERVNRLLDNVQVTTRLDLLLLDGDDLSLLFLPIMRSFYKQEWFEAFDHTTMDMVKGLLLNPESFYAAVGANPVVLWRRIDPFCDQSRGVREDDAKANVSAPPDASAPTVIAEVP